MKSLRCMTVVAVLAAGAAARAEDWNQWRGAARDGSAKAGPALAPWGAEGPRKVWESEPIPADQMGGFSSISVVGDRAYLYVNWKTIIPLEPRNLTERAVKQLGWFPDALPENLQKAMEDARMSEERAALKPQEVKAWIDKWVADHLPDAAEAQKYGGIVRGRLQRGKTALPLDTLAKLAEIRNREFPNQAEIDAWYQDNGIPEDVRKEAAKLIPTTREEARDVVVCLNAADGKTVWKKEYPGRATDWGSSATPCVSGGRVYAAGTRSACCLNAADGAEIWKTELKGNDISSSPLLANGVVVLLAGSLAGLDAEKGDVLWTQAKLSGGNPSAVVWRKDGADRVIVNANQGLACVEPKTGNILWTAPGGGSGTPLLAGDTMILLGANKDVGLIAYRLAPDKAEKLWNVPFTDRGTTPVIHEGHIYTLGSGKMRCVSMDDGAVKWEAGHPGEITSPILADGKVIAMQGGSGLVMFRATPEKYDLLAQAKMKLASCSSPSIANGRLYLRHPNAVACYDLTAAAP